jgi:hypothetical protein
MKRTNILWIVALALGWLFDFLFWKHPQGINFAIYAGLCLGGGFLVLALNGIQPSRKSLLLLVPILFFAIMTFVRLEPVSMFLAYAFTLALMGMLAFTYLGGRWLSYSLSDYVVNYGKLIGSMIARPIIFLSERKKQAGEMPEPALPVLGRPARGADRHPHPRHFRRAALFCRPGLRPAGAGFRQAVPAAESAGVHFPLHLHFDRRLCAGWDFPARRPEEPG